MSSNPSPGPLSRNEHNKNTLNSINQDVNQEPKSEETTQLAFPDGGGRAWTVATACAGILFCTFGYVNSFG
jgi:hypothetical protein